MGSKAKYETATEFLCAEDLTTVRHLALSEPVLIYLQRLDLGVQR